LSWLQDVRKHTAVTTFNSGTSIRDIQFSPSTHSYFQFAAADECGGIQVIHACFCLKSNVNLNGIYNK